MKKIMVPISIICFILVGISFSIYSQNKKPNNQVANIRTSHITSIEVSNGLGINKVVSKEKYKKKLIKLINSVSVLESNIEPLIGIGYGVHIKYDDGTIQHINFLSGSMMICMESSDKKEEFKWYKIDKNLLHELEKVYSAQ